MQLPNYSAKKPFLTAIFAVITVCLLLVTLNSLQKKQPLNFLGHSVYKVASGSMSPTYPVNSLVVVKRVKFNSLKVGDTVLYVSQALNGQLVLHRIVRFSEGGFYCKGDNNQYEDNQLIDQASLVGKATARLDSGVLFIILFIAGFAAMKSIK